MTTTIVAGWSRRSRFLKVAPNSTQGHELGTERGATVLRRLTCVAVAVCLAAAVASAADVTGKWSGELNGPGGAVTLTATFKQDGTRLTGTMEGPGGEAMEIKNGKVEGDTLSFSVDFNGMTVAHEGAITGDTITLQIRMDGGPGGDGPSPITLKRVK
jgi:hypothetical protein